MLKTIIDNHIAIHKKFDARKKRLEEQIRKLEKLNSKYKYWGKTLVEPLAKELQKHIPEYKHFQLLGPFGLRCALSIFFYKETESQLISKFGREEANNRYLKSENLVSITFVPASDEEGCIRYETGEKVKNYQRGTLGDLNGFGNITKPIESIEELVAHLKKQIEKD